MDGDGGGGGGGRLGFLGNNILFCNLFTFASFACDSDAWSGDGGVD